MRRYGNFFPSSSRCRPNKFEVEPASGRHWRRYVEWKGKKVRVGMFVFVLEVNVAFFHRFYGEDIFVVDVVV